MWTRDVVAIAHGGWHLLNWVEFNLHLITIQNASDRRHSTPTTSVRRFEGGMMCSQRHLHRFGEGDAQQFVFIANFEFSSTSRNDSNWIHRIDNIRVRHRWVKRHIQHSAQFLIINRSDKLIYRLNQIISLRCVAMPQLSSFSRSV